MKTTVVITLRLTAYANCKCVCVCVLLYVYIYSVQAYAWLKSLLCKSEQCADEFVRWIGSVWMPESYECSLSLFLSRACMCECTLKCNSVKLKNESTYTDVNLSCVRVSLLILTPCVCISTDIAENNFELRSKRCVHGPLLFNVVQSTSHIAQLIYVYIQCTFISTACPSRCVAMAAKWTMKMRT